MTTGQLYHTRAPGFNGAPGYKPAMKAIAMVLLAASFACPAYRAEHRAYLHERHLVAVLRRRLASDHGARKHNWNAFVGPNPTMAHGRGVSYGWGAV